MKREDAAQGAREVRLARVGLGAPQILTPAVIACLALALLALVFQGLGGAEPSERISYQGFEADVRAGKVAQVRMYREVLVAHYRGGRVVRVQDVSPDYTIGLLRKQGVAYDGLAQPRGGAGAGLLILAGLPSAFLGWLVLAFARAARGEARVGGEAACPRCAQLAESRGRRGSSLPSQEEETSASRPGAGPGARSRPGRPGHQG